MEVILKPAAITCSELYWLRYLILFWHTFTRQAFRWTSWGLDSPWVSKCLTIYGKHVTYEKKRTSVIPPFFMMEHNICFSRPILPVRRLKRRPLVTLSMWGHTIFTTGLKCNEPLTYIGFKTRIPLRVPPVQTLMFNPHWPFIKRN